MMLSLMCYVSIQMHVFLTCVREGHFVITARSDDVDHVATPYLLHDSVTFSLFFFSFPFYCRLENLLDPAYMNHGRAD